MKNKEGNYQTKKFINTLDYSLDLIKLREVYEKVYRRHNFSFWQKNKEYVPSVINVTFRYSNKLFNKCGHNTYVKFGHYVTNDDFKDCVCVRDGELVAIRVNENVQGCPLMNETLGKYFYFDDGVYKAKRTIPTLHSVGDIRSALYRDGFVCDGVRYVRFKRSSGSSRQGRCLFIDEKLYYRMHKWEMCGISLREGQEVDLASLEPYIALTLSSIIDTISIRPENILVVDDFESTFQDKVVTTKLGEDGRLCSRVENAEITNSIWDGQSLMDRQLFGPYADKGMLLLRARFFKSCCFNTNIQQWFRDHHITDVSQLHGRTRAKKIEDILLITTPSSIKYLKFGTLERWWDEFEEDDCVFGVVKHEKKTHFFDGRMVQTHYQLLNTLQMTQEEVNEFVGPSLDYIRKMKTDPAVLREHIGFMYPVAPEEGDGENDEVLTTKNDIIYRILGMNDRFAMTKLYRQFRDETVKAYLKNLRCGHVLVHGNYSTLCGNPIEMLQQAIGEFHGEAVLQCGTVQNSNFDDGKELLGSRSPHVTMGNILLTKNVYYPDILKYMNGTNEIVYVNSIGENLLERLSGAD